jgi:hypothetical protein
MLIKLLLLSTTLVILIKRLNNTSANKPVKLSPILVCACKKLVSAHQLAQKNHWPSIFVDEPMLLSTPLPNNQATVAILTLVLIHHVNANTWVMSTNQVENLGNTIALFTTVSEKTVFVLFILKLLMDQVHQLVTLLPKFCVRLRVNVTTVLLVNQKNVLTLANPEFAVNTLKKLFVTLLKVKLNKSKDHTQKIHAVTNTNALAHQFHNAVK